MNLTHTFSTTYSMLFLYIAYQVRFLAISNVATVSTQGYPDPLEYTTTYRLEYSIDCSVFVSYVDANGIDMVYLHLYKDKFPHKFEVKLHIHFPI